MKSELKLTDTVLHYSYTNLSSSEWIDDNKLHEITNLDKDCWLGYNGESNSLAPFYMKTSSENDAKAIFITVINQKNDSNSCELKFNSYVFYISLSYLANLISHDYLEIEKRLNILRLSDSQKLVVKKLIDKFEIEYHGADFKQGYLKLWGYNFLFHFVNDLYNANRVSFKNIKNSDWQKIEQVRQLIATNIHKSGNTVEYLARSIGMSPTKFKKLFKEITKEPPHHYIQRIRLEKALDLLKANQYTIAQIAYKVGFSHPGAFTRLFRQKYECSPSSITDLRQL